MRDVVDANIITMTPNINFGIFNAGTGIGTTFNNVSLINNFLDTSIKPRYIENPLENYVYDIIADLAQMSRSLGFRPKWTLEKGINFLIDYYRNAHNLSQN